MITAAKDTPEVTLMKSYPLIRTSSSFQRFLLDRLRQENIESEEEPPGLGFGALDDPTNNETVWQLEDWISDNEADFESMVSNEANQGC